MPVESHFCHLPQQLSHPAVLLREPAVAGRAFPVFIPMKIAAFGCFFECLRGSVVPACRLVQALGCNTGAECLFGGPPTGVKLGLVAAFCVGQ